MATSPVATATYFAATWRFTRVVSGKTTYWRGARTNAGGEVMRTPKVFHTETQLQNYLDWLQRHGWRVQFAGLMPARPRKVATTAR